MTRWNAGTVGQFTTDAALVVQTWDAWMASATGIEEPAACGQRLDALYPELLDRGLLGRIARVAEGRGVDVLAPALHKYLLPCAPLDPTSRFTHMRQHVTISPLLLPDGPAGVLITSKAVTARSGISAQSGREFSSYRTSYSAFSRIHDRSTNSASARSAGSNSGLISRNRIE